MSFDPWTFGFQAVNVLVLVWLLHRFFWTPVAATIDARQAGARDLLDGAEADRAEAREALARIATTRDGLAAGRDTLIAAARAEAGTTRDALLAEARAEAVAVADTAKAARVQAAAALKATAIADAQGLAVVIAGRLLARLDSAATEAAFLGWLTHAIADLPGPERQALAAADLMLVGATDADAATRDRIAGAVAEALGATPKLGFRTDAGLIAGLELHGPHVTLRNSWQADLSRIAAALAADQGLPDAA